MELNAFRVSGIRCLADVDWVPVAHPTILTGPNDGGKTSVLLALEFLLAGRGIAKEDFTSAAPDEVPDHPIEDGRYAECWVEGRFLLDQNEQGELELPAEIRMRRRLHVGGSSDLEVHRSAPVDERLRGLPERKLDELRAIAAEVSIEPTGPANRRDSYLMSLQALADGGPHQDVWMPAPRDAADRLPRLISFASTAEPDPEAEIRQALQEAYARALEDPSIVAPVREAERQVRTTLEGEALELRTHIIERCPELSDLVVEPSVSFKEGFAGVRLSSSRGEGHSVGLSASGAGTRRRITLATWEWTRVLLSRGEPAGRSVILAYDEPDTHLDYGHQRDLVDLIRRQCDVTGVRVMMATHSLNLIDKVSIEDVVHLDLVRGRTMVRRLFSSEHGDVERHLMDVAASMGLRNSVLLHERCFVGVEGVTEQQAIPLLFRRATGLTLQAAGIALVPAGGNTGALAFCKYLTEHGREVRFIVDRDSAAHRTFAPMKLQAAGVSAELMYLVGSPDEIEDLFTDDQWTAVANKVWPRDDGNQWTPSHFAPLRKSGKFSTGLHELIKVRSSAAPPSKAALLPALAGMLEAKDEIPGELVEVFEDLIRVTSAR